MKKTIKILGFLLLMMTVVLPTALAAEKNPQATVVQVNGNYHMEIAPDTAYIQLGTVTEAETVAAAQAKNADISTKIRLQLADLGIKPDSIQTAHYVVTPLYNSDNSGRRIPSIKGYQITNSITVTTSVEKAGEVVDTALQAGANQVNSIQFTKKNENDVKNAALAQAVRDALSKAEAIAIALDKRIVRITTVNENGIYLQLPETSNRLYAKAAMADTTTPISAGLIKISANVQLAVELE